MVYQNKKEQQLRKYVHNMKPYNKELVDFIEQNKDKYFTNELVLMIENRFNKKITTKALRKYFYRHNLSFKRKYNRKDKAIFAKEIGFESPPDKNGLVRIKINDKQWQYKQRYLYEKYNSVKLGENYVVIFADGDKTNFSKDNLIAVPKEVMKTFYAITHDDKICDKELTKVGLKVAIVKNRIRTIKE